MSLHGSPLQPLPISLRCAFLRHIRTLHRQPPQWKQQKVFAFWLQGQNPNALTTAAMVVNLVLSAIFYDISEKRVEVLRKLYVHTAGPNLQGRLPEMGTCMVENARAETDKGVQRQMRDRKGGMTITEVGVCDYAAD